METPAIFQDLLKTAREAANKVAGKLSEIAPELKKQADKLVQIGGDINEVIGSIGAAIGAHNLQEVGSHWGDASKSWDDGVKDTVRRQVIIDKGYPTDRPLTKEEEAALEKDVKEAQAKFEAAWRERVGENLFEFGSAIKNGGAEAVQAIDQYIRIKDIYSTPTSTGNLTDLSNKIQATVQTTIDATQKIASAGQRVFKWLMHNDSNCGHSESVILNNLKNIGISRLGMGATALAGTAVGINAMVSAFKTGGITGAISAGKTAYTSVRGQWDAAEKARDKFFDDKKKIVDASKDGRHPFWKHDPPPPPPGQPDPTEIKDPIPDPAKQKEEQGQKSQEDSNQGGAEFVSEITVVLDGKKGSGNSLCSVGDKEYQLSGYTLSQSMLQPMLLSFTMIKNSVATEDEKDVKHDMCKRILGVDIEITVKTQYSDATSAKASEFTFKGLITGVSASRESGTASPVYVTAASYDYLLDGTPNCRSFENKTLEEIVTAVTGAVDNLKCSISPRLKAKIPYIVQYNQTDYQFLASLAKRFGEWMYHDGTKFVFGEIVPPSDSVVTMRYPGGNVFSHGIDMQLRDINFMHVTSNHYKYDKGGIIKQSDMDIELGKIHELSDIPWERLKSLYKQRNVHCPHIGGAFDNGEDEGTEELMRNSTTVETWGKRAQMLVCNGASKVAKLFLGQKFQIEDGVENKSTDKGEVNQHPLMVLSVTHRFGLDQTYENTFEALPPACEYPPYGNTDVFVTAYPQRATVMDNDDPQGLGRVRVQFPWQKVQELEGEPMWTPWIRIAQSYGGLSKGSYFVSEKGEEVMIDFEMNNVERPYVIGTLYNGTGRPDGPWTDGNSDGTVNNYKVIRTRNGHTLQFCDEGQGGDIQIYDHEKNNYLIHLSTDGKFIRIEAKGNVEIVAGNDITMKAAKNIKIEAGENISIESGKDTDLSADQSMSLSAQDSMRQQANDISAEAKDAINHKSGNTYTVKTGELKQKADSKMSMDGGALLEATAASVKIR